MKMSCQPSYLNRFFHDVGPQLAEVQAQCRRIVVITLVVRSYKARIRIDLGEADGGTRFFVTPGYHPCPPLLFSDIVSYFAAINHLSLKIIHL